MSDASLPRRSPRSPVSAPPRTRGGNSTSSGGGSHLKPPAPGSSCKNETPIRLAPQEDIDDSPPPGRAAQFRAPGARSSLAKPRQSATSCPRSPPPSPGHGQRPAAALRGRSPPQSSPLCTFLDQVQLSPASPSPPSSPKGEKPSFQVRVRAVAAAKLRLRSAPGGSETIGNPGLRGAGFPSFRFFF